MSPGRERSPAKSEAMGQALWALSARADRVSPSHGAEWGNPSLSSDQRGETIVVTTPGFKTQTEKVSGAALAERHTIVTSGEFGGWAQQSSLGHRRRRAGAEQSAYSCI